MAKGPKITYETYKLAGDRRKRLVKRVGDGSIVKRFDLTPYAEKESDVVCPHFLELKWAYGCPYNCSWCYLQGTLRLLPGGKKPVVKDYAKIEKHVRAFLETRPPEILNSGEICDSLMAERTERPFSKFIIPLFEGTPHKVLFLTKSDYVKNLLEIEEHDSAIMSFTVNPKVVSKTWERGAPSPGRRLKAAQELRKKDYEVRLRIDPIVPIDGWREYYGGLVKDIEDVDVSRVTLGTLRGLRTTIAKAKDKSWVKFFEGGERTSWGRKMSAETRHEIYDYLIEQLSNIGVDVGVCKETIGMWGDLGMEHKKIKCNCIL